MHSASRCDRRAIAAAGAPASSGRIPATAACTAAPQRPRPRNSPHERLIGCGKRELPDQPGTRWATGPTLPAKLAREHHSHTPGVVFDPGDPFHAGLLQAIHPAADRCGYEIVLGARVPAGPSGRPSKARSRLAAVIGTQTEAGHLVGTGRPAPGSRLPVAVLGRRGGDADVDGVRTAGNSEAQGRRGAARRPGSPPDPARRRRPPPGAAERRRGHRAAMRRHRPSWAGHA